VNLSDPGGNSWLDRTWERVFGEGSFNRTFGDRASAWSDRTFGNQRDQVYAAAWTGPGRYSTTYHEWKRHQEQPVYEDVDSMHRPAPVQSNPITKVMG
jgi:hypothetical protein